MKKTTKVILYFIIFLILVFTCIYAYETLYKKQTPIDNENKYNISDNIDYTVILKPNGNSNETYIYLDSGYGYGETPFITIDNVYKEHYHNNEFVNGNLYIIKRTGYNGNENDNWTDELWKYDKNGKGTKIFSARGIDFRTFNNGENLAIINGPILKIIDNEGLFLKEFYSKDLSIDPKNTDISLGFLPNRTVNNSDIILGNFITMSVLGLTKIDINSEEIIKYNFEDFSVNLSEFDINPSLNKIVFSTYIYSFDYDSEKEYMNNNVKVDLIVYNLNTKEKNIITTRKSSDGRFSPTWIDDTMVEYQIPITEEGENDRVQTNI